MIVALGKKLLFMCELNKRITKRREKTKTI